MRKSIRKVETEQDARDLHLNILHSTEEVQKVIYDEDMTPSQKGVATKEFDHFVNKEMFTPGYVKYLLELYSKFTDEVMRKIQLPWNTLETESDVFTDEEVKLLTELSLIRSADNISANIKLNRHLLGAIK